MKIAVFGKTPESKSQLLKAVKKAGFTYSERKPDIIISYGGDGTFLLAEQKYPGIPKTLFRFSKICNKCHNLPINHALDLLKKKKYKIISHKKLQARVGKKTLLATNDIVFRNATPTHAIRFKIWVNGKQIDDELIGDGVLVATTFGSTGYFYSITKKTFKKGIAIAFNNTTVKHDPIFLPEHAKIRILVTRGKVQLGADNQPKILTLGEKKSVTITVSTKKAKQVSFRY